MVALFPDAELTVIDYLRPLLQTSYPGIFISNKRESQLQAVWVRRDGGPVLDVAREAARITINCYSAGSSDANVSLLARRVSAFMRSPHDGTPIVAVAQLSGPSVVAGSVPQRVMSFDVFQRGEETAT